MLMFRMAECNYKLNNYKQALVFLNKAEKIDARAHRELHLLSARSYHRTEQFDLAQEQLDKFKTVLEGKKKAKELLSDDKFLKEELEIVGSQIVTAKEMIKSPVNVKIVNVGKEINSEYEDYRPSISADGKTMIFTSRRADSKGGLIAADKKFYEDIYITTWNSETSSWNTAESIKGRLNTEEHDACLSIAPAGNVIYVYKNIDGVTKSGDIYYSKITSSGKWGAARALGKTINSTYFESAASITVDEKKIFFVSERKGGIGQGDIYMAKKISKREFGEPVGLGDAINTVYDENAVYINPTGTMIVFSSEGHNSMGGYDIFVSKFDGSTWTKPKNIGYPINSVNDDVHFTMTADGKTGYFARFDKDSSLGERDIYKVDFSNYTIFK